MSAMSETIDTLIVGAGQAGLALSRLLAARGREHLVVERGRVAERWRSERWDSFRLLTPSWLTRLPGRAYAGPEPDGFLGRDEVVDFFEGYARSFAAPVRTGVTVRDARRVGGRWHVTTDHGLLRADVLVAATGGLGQPVVPAGLAAALPASVAQLHSSRYRNPDALPDGAVLVVGAGPSGQQIARELAAAGRRVHLAVGRHRVLPRRYRGRDAYAWLHELGLLTAPAPEHRPRRRPAPGVVLAGGRGDLDLRILAARGVHLHGRMVAVDGRRVRFADDLALSLRGAEANAARFRAHVDALLHARGGPAPRDPAPWSPPRWALQAPRDLDLAQVGSVIWATGFKPAFPWLRAPVFTRDGEPRHVRGVSVVPGLAFLGLRWQHHRTSHQIAGVGSDAAHLAAWIARGALAPAAA